MDHPISDRKISEDFPQFVAELEARLRKGAEQYGDSSFNLEVLKIVAELKQEAMDITGWGFILWDRLNELEKLINFINSWLATKAEVFKPFETPRA